MTIAEIENLSESDVQNMQGEKFDIKGFSVYLVDLGEYFGYSAVVFKNNHQIKHANDYQLHHPSKSNAELKELYLDSLQNKLFTDDEICGPLKSDEDYRQKEYFIHNYYALQADRISYFQSYRTEKERQQILAKTKNMYDNMVGMCWMYDKNFVDNHVRLWVELQKRKAHAMESFEYCKSAFLYEMYNHEYGINWQADYDVLNCFTKVEYSDSDGTRKYLERSGFTDMQKKAYLAAKQEYYANAEL